MTHRIRIAVGQVYEFTGTLAVPGTFEVVGVRREDDGRYVITFDGDRGWGLRQWSYAVPTPWADDPAFERHYRFVADPVAA